MGPVILTELEQSMSVSMLDFVHTYGLAVQKAPNTRQSALNNTHSTAMLTTQNNYNSSASKVKRCTTATN